MSVYKKIKGKDVEVANTVIDHSQLSGTKNYGCHPISAIRNLPEKLTDLKEKINEVNNELTNKIDNEIVDREVADNNLNTRIDSVEEKAKGISLSSGEGEHAGKIVFHSYEGEEVYVQGGYLPDEETIKLEEISGEERLVARSLKKANNDVLSPDTIESLINTNSDAIKAVDAKFEPVDNRLDNIESDIIGINTGISIINQTNSEQDIKIKDLQNFTKGIGGYLDSYNFGTSTPTEDELTQYALQDIGITDVEQI